VVHLRILELYDCTPEQTPGLDLHVIRLQHLPELKIRVDPGIFPMLPMLDVIMLFAKIDHLIIEGMPVSMVTMLNLSMGQRYPLVAIGTLEVNGAVHNLGILARSLCKLLDTSSMRQLRFHNAIPLELEPLLSTANDIELLAYRVSDRPPTIPAPSNLRSLIVSGRILIESHGPSEWNDILRDLYVLTNPLLTELSVTLQVYEDPRWVELDTLGQNVPFEYWEEALRAQDWDGLLGILKRCPQLRELNINVELQPNRGYIGELAKDIDRCAEVIISVVEERFGEEAEKVPWHVTMKDCS
jgi:hypothetical protein